MKRAKTKTPSTPPPPAPPPRDFSVTLNLSEADRWFAAVGLSKAPWGGGEARIAAYGAIHDVLQLEDIPRDKQAGQLSRSAKTYTLKASQVEELLVVLTGGAGFSFVGEAGPMLAKLVGRIRSQIEKARPKKEKAQ